MTQPTKDCPGTRGTSKANEVAVDKLGALPISEFCHYMDRDLIWLEGAAAALQNSQIASKIHGMKRNLKRLRLNVESPNKRRGYLLGKKHAGGLSLPEEIELASLEQVN